MDGKQKNYVEEIVALIHGSKDIQKLLEMLEEYHENDIAEALEFLTKEERVVLYAAWGIERVSEIFAYLEDATIYFEEIKCFYKIFCRTCKFFCHCGDGVGDSCGNH